VLPPDRAGPAVVLSRVLSARPVKLLLRQCNVQLVAAGSYGGGKKNCRDDLFSPKFLWIDSEPSKSRIDDGNSDLGSHAMVFDRKLRTLS